MTPPGKDTRLFVSGEIKEAIEAESWRWKALDVAVKVSMPILLGISAWTATTLLDHDKRLEVIEATRYTREDAERERDQIRDALGDIRVLLAQKASSDRALQEDVAEIKQALKSLEARLSK